MKIRTGFVSNSSSSSFVIIGKIIRVDEITEKEIEDEKIFCDTGLYGSEGRYGEFITKEMFEDLKLYGYAFEFYKAVKSFSGEGKGKFKTINLIDKEYDVLAHDFDHSFNIPHIQDLVISGERGDF